MSRARIALAALAVLGPSACGVLSGGLTSELPPPHGYTGGEDLVVVADTWLQEVDGPGLEPSDHLGWSQARRPIPVIPAGARMQVRDDFLAHRDVGGKKRHADRNPWIYVDVVESPVPTQQGWSGWVHTDTVARAETNAAPTPDLGNLRVGHRANLCSAEDDIELNCVTRVGTEHRLKLRECRGARALVEMWTEEGAYLSGYLTTAQLVENPCEAR